jgi:hypothetical protein
MASRVFKGFVGLSVASSLLFTSTAAMASAPVSAPSQVSPWAVLTVMSGGAPAAAMCGAAAVAGAMQAPGGCVLPALDTPPPVATTAPPAPIPVPPVEPASAGLGISPLLLALAAIAAGVGLYFLLHKHHSNSPA